MKYLKKYNESTLSYNESEELKKICNLNLSYLIDDGYNIDISEVTYDRSKDEKNTYIIFYKRYSDRNRNVCREFHLDDEVKDSLIPFIETLSNNYNIGDKIICQFWHKYKISDDKLCTLAELDTERLRNLRSIWIKIDGLKELNESQKMNKLKLSVAETEKKSKELKEFCNNYLIYLLEDGYKLEFNNFFSYDIRSMCTSVKLTKNNNKHIDWLDIKDEFLSFIEILLENYTLVKIDNEGDVEMDVISIEIIRTNNRFNNSQHNYFPVKDLEKRLKIAGAGTKVRRKSIKDIIFNIKL